MRRAILASVAISALLLGPASAFNNMLMGFGAGASSSLAPVALLDTEVVGLDYPNNGTSTSVAGTSLTLTAKPGQWSGNVISRSYRWHTVSDPLTSLGTSTTLAIDISATPALVGQVIEVDETASGLGGSSIRQSHWFGPIGSTAPVAPIAYETLGTSGPSSLPVSPARFLENGHAIFPGCDIPPVAPDTSNPAHVWYFDSVHGTTIDAGATGHAGSPFKDVSAFLGATIGYQSLATTTITSITNITGTTAQLNGTGFFSFPGQIVYVNGLPQTVFSAPAGRIIITLNPPGITPTLANTEIDFPVFPRLIQPGDTVYIEPGDSSHPVGAIIGSADFSTSDGTATGSTVWTWVMGDPAASRPVLNRIAHTGGSIGFIYKGLNLEPPAQGTNDIPVTTSGTAAAPSHNMVFEDLRVSSWIGHSGDQPFNQPYPTTGGQSDGTVVTATPVFGQGQGENVPRFTATMAMGDTSASVPGLVPSGLNPLFGEYVFSPNYFQSNVVGGQIPPGVSGIPNGTKIATINGLGAANFLYVGNTVATFAALPATWAITDAIFLITSNSHLAHWDGTSWTDLGTTLLQFAPCDSTNPVDVASGCPTTNYPGLSGSGHDNVPGCDPLTIVRGTTYGGCPSGTPPAWHGATRAISAEALIFMPTMRVNPAGHYNNGDWGTAMSYAFSFAGILDTAHSQDPSNPNLFVGSDCISVKDSWVREVFNGFLASLTTNSVFYNNRIKWTNGDAFDHFADHRNWTIHNRFSDPQDNWIHVDGIQYAISLGTGTQIQYGNAAIENELLQSTDTTAEFPTSMQAIGNTDGVAWGIYIADNAVNATTNGIAGIGFWNVVVHNINLGTGISVAPQPKTGSSAPIHSMMANNIANGVGRDPKFFNANYCDPVTGDLDEVWTNLSIPRPADLVLSSSVACNLNHTISNGAIPGLLDGVIAWTSATDWRSQQAGVSSLFTDYDPIGPPVAPAPGAGIWSTAEQFPCVNMSFFPFGCKLGGAGAMNERPNTGFAGTTNTILATVKDIRFLPQTGSIGDTYVASVAEGCFGAGQATSCGPNAAGVTACGFSNANQIVWPAGLYVRARTTTAAVCGDGDFTQWVFTGSLPNPVLPPYNPGIVGAGTYLGAQTPITDLDGKAWKNPPSIGAYEAP